MPRHGARRRSTPVPTRLPDGREVDLTRQQFVDGESVGPPDVAGPRPPTLPAEVAKPYVLLARRVRSLLDLHTGPGRTIPSVSVVSTDNAENVVTDESAAEDRE